MISSSHKFIYLHPARTGGSSIERVLGSYADEVVKDMTEPSPYVGVFLDGRISKHFLLRRYYQLRGAEETRYQVFITARNPWERAVSAWANSPQRARPFREFMQTARFDAYGRNQVVDFLKVDDRYRKATVIQYGSLQQGFDAMCMVLGIARVILPCVGASEHGPYQEYYDDGTRDQVARAFKDDIREFKYSFGS